jgi:hypothetical protein
LLSHFLTDEQGSALVALMTADDVKKTIFRQAGRHKDLTVLLLNSFNPAGALWGK